MIFVSHRFATVRSADVVMVLDQGEVVEMGTHDELMGADGLYHDLFELQAERYGMTTLIASGRERSRDPYGSRGRQRPDEVQLVGDVVVVAAQELAVVIDGEAVGAGEVGDRAELGDRGVSYVMCIPPGTVASVSTADTTIGSKLRTDSARPRSRHFVRS